LPTTFLFSFLHSYLHPPHVHSFPTRRSYDLAWLGSQDVIAASRGLKQPEQLSWGIGHVGLPGARQQLPIVEFYVPVEPERIAILDRKSTRLNSSHDQISYAVFCLKKKNKRKQ